MNPLRSPWEGDRRILLLSLMGKFTEPNKVLLGGGQEPAQHSYADASKCKACKTCITCTKISHRFSYIAAGVKFCIYPLMSVSLNMILKEKDALEGLFRRSYFWDVDIGGGKAIPERLVIERIFSLGSLAEIALVVRYFGKKEVKKTLCNLNYIDHKTLNFISKLFGIPKREFRCYIRKQSIPQHWNY